jgi:hypothetical protein
MEEIMSNEWEKLKEALQKPATPEAMQAASAAFAQYRQVSLAKSSRPILVNLGKGTGYPNAVPVDQIPDELAKNPQFYDFMKKFVNKE